MLEKIRDFFSVAGQGVLIAFIVIFFVCPLSCKISEAGIELISGDYITPKLEDCSVVDERHIQLVFTEDVKLSSVSVTLKNHETDSKNSIDNVNASTILCTSDKSLVSESRKIMVELSEQTKIGESYIISGVVEDAVGNSMTFSIPFSGYNKNIPKLLITEVQVKYASKNDKTYSFFKSDYVELLALEDGNLFGLAIGSATNGDSLDYHFPAIEVKKGEVFVVHFRIMGDGCITELGDDLNLSFAPHCRNGVRDIWLDNTGSVFTDTYDAIYVKDCINNKFVNGFMYINKKKKTAWSSKISDKADELTEAGIFPSSSVDDALDSDGNTPSKPMIRKKENILQIVNETNEKLKNGEDIKYPIMFCKDNWEIRENEPGDIIDSL